MTGQEVSSAVGLEGLGESRYESCCIVRDKQSDFKQRTRVYCNTAVVCPALQPIEKKFVMMTVEATTTTTTTAKNYNHRHSHDYPKLAVGCPKGQTKANAHLRLPPPALTSDSNEECVSSGLAQDATNAADVRNGVGEEHEVHLTGKLHVVLLEVLDENVPQA